jgi:DNA modification methylase
MALTKVADRAAEFARALEAWPVKAGQVWVIPSKMNPGNVHRLMCGHAGRRGNLRRLMAGEPARLVLTDPPYCSGGNSEASKAGGSWADGAIASDNLSSRGYRALMSAALDATSPGSAYMFTDWRMWSDLSDTSEVCGLATRGMLVWDKKSPALGGLWRRQHELVLFGSREGAGRMDGRAAHSEMLGTFEAPGSIIIACSRSGNKRHYTEKPVALLDKILEGDEASLRGACAVTDTFCGSGPTLEACEGRGRASFLMEWMPIFVAATLQRAAGIGLEPRLEKAKGEIE